MFFSAADSFQMEEYSPRYSIIIPFYNAERFLRECLNSIVSQSFIDWECFCVDDGSEDNGRRIVEEYAVKDSRIHYVSQVKLGAGIARNSGIKLSRGKYLVFVDADDFLLPEALHLLSSETADIVTYLKVSDKSTAACTATFKQDFYVDKLSNVEYAQVIDSLGGNLLAWNAIYLRERMGDVKFPNLINCEDLVYCAKTFSKARTITAGLPCWYFHREVEGSAANSHSWRRVFDTLKTISPMFIGYYRCIRGWQMWYILMRKLTLHFILHVLAEIPKAMIHSRCKSISLKIYFKNDCWL